MGHLAIRNNLIYEVVYRNGQNEAIIVGVTNRENTGVNIVFQSTITIDEDIPLTAVVTEIGDKAFMNCTSFKGVSNNSPMPATVRKIGDYAFMNCTSLSSITFGDSVETIGKYAFYNCAGLQQAYNLACVDNVDKTAFEGTKIYTSY